MKNRTYRFKFQSPNLVVMAQADCTRDALAIALEHSGRDIETLVEIEQPDPDDPYNQLASVSLAGAALDIWL